MHHDCDIAFVTPIEANAQSTITTAKNKFITHFHCSVWGDIHTRGIKVICGLLELFKTMH